MSISVAPASALYPMLDKLSMRSSLSPDEERAVLALPHRRSFLDAGAHIVRNGDRAEKCCVLLAGFTYRHKVIDSGARQILSVNIKGDIVDLQNSLLDHADHNVQALTRAEVALIPRQAILDLCKRYPGVAHALWVDTLVDSSIFREWIVNVGRRGARERIAHLFCELALRQEAAGLCERPNYVWPMTQEQLGDATGLTSVHVNRVLQRLRGERLISTTRQQVTILDWANLQEAGDFNRDYLHLTPHRDRDKGDGYRLRTGDLAAAPSHGP